MAETVIPIPGPQTVVLSLTDITAVGPPGLQGPQGIQGPIGPQGAVGPPLNVKGTVADSSHLPASGNAVGDVWITANDGHGHSWNGTAWIDTGPFQGPPGPQGVQGVQGVPGIAATLVAGTTTTGAPGTSANVVASGTPSAQRFDFTIPSGLQGTTGSTGPTGPVGGPGPTGPQGVQGPAGPPLNMKGTVATASALPPSGNNAGDLYMALDTGHAWVWSTATGPWTDTGPFQGPVGPAGPGAQTTVSTAFTVPAYGASVAVNVADSTFPAVGEMVYVGSAAGANAAGALQVTAKVAGQMTLLNPLPAPAIPLASPSGPGLLTTLSGLTTDFIDGTNTCQPHIIAYGSMRLRSYNAIGNPNFEVDQRNVGTLSASVANGAFTCDRWIWGQNPATAKVNSQRQPASPVIPGTGFQISGNDLLLQVNTAQATLAAGEYVQLYQIVEGINSRPLFGSPTSISLFVQSSIAPLHFSVAVRDTPGTKSYCHLCTVPTAGVPTLITIPNIPAFPAGNFVTTPGAVGYTISICLGAGATFTAPAADSWQTGSYIAAPGTDNWFANPVNTNFLLFFCQHEPSAVPSTLIDKPFSVNLDECLRYYQKSYPYATAVGNASYTGSIGATSNGVQPIYIMCGFRFPKIMAKTPTGVAYSESGAANNVRDIQAGVDRVAANVYMTDGGLMQINVSPGGVANNAIRFHYTADTGW